VLDDETVIRIPHDATVTRRDGKKHVEVHDPRVSVTVQSQGAAVMLFFNPGEGLFTGEAELLEIRLTPPESGRFEPWRLMPRLPVYRQHARAELAVLDDDRNNHPDAITAIRAGRQVMSTKRGLTDRFLWLVAHAYSALVAEGEPHPIKMLAEMTPVDISTASRWVSAARDRGFLEAKETEK
jgi:hypothetical protein